MKIKIYFLVIMLSLFSSNSLALTYFEVGDTGELLTTAQNVGNGIDVIEGELENTGDIVDLYGLNFDFSGQVNFSLSHTSTWFDEVMFVFNSAGNPLLISDFKDFTLDVNPDTYYFAISDWNIAAIDESGKSIADDYYNIFVADGVLAGWEVNSSPFRYGGYSVELSQATSPVPEPATMLLLGSGLVGLAGFRRKCKK